MNFPKFAVHRPVLVSVIFVIMGLFGVYSLMDLPIDLMPDIEAPAISVITVYRGAGSEEVEEKVTRVIESALASTAGMKNIYSRSMEGVSTVSCEFEYGTDLSEATNKIRDLLNMTRSYLPDDIDEPLVFKFDFSMMPILFLAITSSKEDIRYKGEEIDNYITNYFERIPGVGSVITFNEMRKKIIISADKQRLSALNLTVDDLVNTVRAENLSLPAGNIEIGAYDYTIRVPGEYRDIDEVNETIVASTPAGLIRVRDVARVFWGSEDARQYGIKDGEYMVFMMVQKQSGANTVAIADALKKEIEKIQPRLPEGFRIGILLDSSDFIVKMIRNLSMAALTACFFVILVVVFFLRRFRSSFIVLLAIPASMLIAFAFLYGFGFTLNLVSLMSLSLAIGMVVDNSIVALDNITRHLESGKNRRDAAVDGTAEVGGAILASALTTIVIFAPLFFVGGLIGILFGQLAGVIVLTIAASLLAAMLLTPMVCSRILSSGTSARHDNWFFRLGERFLAFVEEGYTKVIEFTLRRKKRTIFAAGLIFIASLFIVPVIGVDFLPEGDEGMIQIEYELPLGSRIEETLKIGQHIERIIREEVPAKYIERVFLRGGPDDSGFSQKVQDTNTGLTGTKLVSQNYRKEGVKFFANKIRARIIAEVPGIEKMDVKTSSGFGDLISGGDKPVTVKLAHKDFKKLNASAARLEKELEKIPGLKDIGNDADSLKPQVEVKIDRVRASQVGLKTAMVATAVRNAFYGSTASVYRKDGNEFEIMVKYKKADRENLEQLKELEIKTLYGTVVKLKDVAEVKEGLTSLSVNRQNRERIVSVGARLEEDVAIGKIGAEVEKALERAQIDPEIGVLYGGTLKSQKENTGDLLRMLLLGILLVYLVMAAQFESFVDPFVIIFSIPFAISGVLIGLLLMGHTLSVPAFLGMIILVGIVVNNAIVLIDYTKIQQEKHRFSTDEALIYSGARRLRPILMTAATTIFGMVPLALVSGEGHETYNPMGVAVVFGLAFSTLVTLVLIPCMYSTIDAFLRKRGWRTD